MNIITPTKEQPMTYETIIFEQQDEIAIIRFNRPKALNAINPTVIKEISDALDKITANSSIRVLILPGEGDKAFVAGADIATMRDFTASRGEHSSDKARTSFCSWRNCLYRLKTLYAQWCGRAKVVRPSPIPIYLWL